MQDSAQYWLQLAVDKGTSDIFIGAGRHVSFKLNGVITSQSENRISPAESKNIVEGLYTLANRSMDNFIKTGDDDFPVTLPGVARFRVSAYNQRGTLAAVVRVVMFQLPDRQTLCIPDEAMVIANEKNGIALVTGPAGSGKTTTLACIIDAINKTRNCHIITLEDPIEYLHRDNKSLVSQREISTDTESYITALRTCLRQAPDIILLGEMRDMETIKIAMTAAETGHLIISTLHTVGAVNTIDRIVDVFPPEQQQQVRVQLSMLLRTVVSQQLIVNKEGGITPAFEIMHNNAAVRNLIREGKTHQIDNAIQTTPGMVGMDAYIINMVQQGKVDKDVALTHAFNTEQMMRTFERLRL